MQRPRGRDCPHIRGEKLHGRKVVRVEAGSPPRVRGKARPAARASGGLGITPARAGKRRTLSIAATISWDHPRVCGEKVKTPIASPASKGSPPRVRGKGYFFTPTNRTNGITPACAGKRKRSYYALAVEKDHPRVCGEKMPKFKSPDGRVGSPPRARGKAYKSRYPLRTAGITPACAGKRTSMTATNGTSGDHPRVRGEKSIHTEGSAPRLGSPPRARGKDAASSSITFAIGITPACAGKRVGTS